MGLDVALELGALSCCFVCLGWVCFGWFGWVVGFGFALVWVWAGRAGLVGFCRVGVFCWAGGVGLGVGGFSLVIMRLWAGFFAFFCGCVVLWRGWGALGLVLRGAGWAAGAARRAAVGLAGGVACGGVAGGACGDVAVYAGLG